VTKPQVIDVFPYLDEEGPLLARYLILKDVVDLFIGVEGNLTHSGEHKSNSLRESVERMGIPKGKVMSLEVELDPDLSPFERDAQQRDYARKFVIDNFTPNDILVFGDADEVPSISGIAKGIESVNQRKEFAHLAMEMTVGYMNNVETSHRLLSHMGEYSYTKRVDRRWLGTSISKVKSIYSLSLSELRNPSRKVEGERIQDSGWHFSYCGGSPNSTPVDRITDKLRASAHQEFSSIRKEIISRRLYTGRDILGRRFIRFKFVEPGNFLPHEVLSNPLLEGLIYKL
jgi:beta-1,4-mannosyl-glycoprotein beta-1,4-N-acetylglucosaminyltransferase